MQLSAPDEPIEADISTAVGDIVFIGVVLAVVIFLTATLRPLIRRIIRRLSRRSLEGASDRWRLRVPRVFGESMEMAELRRQQRIDATSVLLSRIGAFLLWILAVVLILDRLGINAVLAISGAGFLGAALAFGGQNSVADFLSGFHALLDDRYGEGDTLSVRVGDRDVIGVVARLGAFATRIETDEATWHVANRELATVANLSQRGITSTMDITIGPEVDLPLRTIGSELRTALESSHGYDPDRDGLYVDHVDRGEDGRLLITFRTTRPLTDAQRQRLEERLGRF
ncbi:MAG: mechanosensitive ion channel [Actinomycetota bacterium]|nr:mechanosensitive ion channel [Actinomycetota bacterium]